MQKPPEKDKLPPGTAAPPNQGHTYPSAKRSGVGPPRRGSGGGVGGSGHPITPPGAHHPISPSAGAHHPISPSAGHHPISPSAGHHAISPAAGHHPVSPAGGHRPIPHPGGHHPIATGKGGGGHHARVVCQPPSAAKRGGGKVSQTSHSHKAPSSSSSSNKRSIGGGKGSRSSKRSTTSNRPRGSGKESQSTRRPRLGPNSVVTSISRKSTCSKANTSRVTQTDHNDNDVSTPELTPTTRTPPASVIHTKTLKRPTDWQLTPAHIKLGIRIGEGAYGEVFLANLLPEGPPEEPPIAVKVVRQIKVVTNEDKAKFLKEARILCSYIHPNLVTFLGFAVVKEDPVMIAMEFCPGGSLHVYLVNMGDKINSLKRVRFCQEASEGMLYLEQQGCIHRDVAARNCLIGSKNELKITDFGLSNQIKIFKDTPVERAPIRWLAPETMTGRVYTAKTDVWSFGVLLWEIFSEGREPYSDLTNKEVIEKVGKGKGEYRLAIPDNCRDPIDDVIGQCWSEIPYLRPHFQAIRDALKEA